MKGRLVFTIDLDDWYHVGWIAGRNRALFHDSSDARNRYSGEGLRSPTERILDLFDEYSVTTTFFVQGEVAQEYPDLVERIIAQGHEIGSHDLHHVSPRIRSLQKFREDVVMSKSILEDLVKQPVLGYRSPNGELTAANINMVEELGFRYDASVYPCLPIPGFYGRPFAPMQPYRPSREDLSRHVPDRPFVEFPFAVIPYARIPGGSCWYLRNLGIELVRLAVKSQLKRGYACFNMHPYEISDKIPEIHGLPSHVFKNVGKETYLRISALLHEFSRICQFTSFRDCLRNLSTR